MQTYKVQVNDKTYFVDVTNIEMHQEQQLSTDSNIDLLACDTTKLEYENSLRRSEKLDNKIYIILTICALLFVLITDILKKISTFSIPNTIQQMTLIILFTIILTITLLLYGYILLNLTKLLKGAPIQRFDPIVILERDMLKSDTKSFSKYICSKYNQCIATNNQLLGKQFIKYNKCLYCLAPVLLLSVFLIFISNFIK